MIGGLSPAPPLLEGRYAVPPNPPHTSVICGAVMVGLGAWVWLGGCLDGWGRSQCLLPLPAAVALADASQRVALLLWSHISHSQLDARPKFLPQAVKQS
jgi:hypothetical protein